MEEARKKEVERAKIGEAHMNIEIRDVLVIIVYLGGREKESTRIRGRKATRNIRRSSCHLLNSSRLLSLWRDSNGQNLRGVIRIEETNPDTMNTTRMSDIRLMNVIDSKGC